MATTVASLVVRISASVADFEKAMAGMEKKWARQGAKFQQIGRDLTTGLTLPIVAVGGLAVKAASDFESSFAGVRKTVDGVVDQGGELTEFGKQLQQEFRNLAKEIPVSVNELNKIGEMAGQLGVKSEHIMDFTRTIAAMGVATNLTTEQAADGMARFANVTQMPMENIGRLGSTIAHLGNKLATTESEILNFGIRIASAGDRVGMTEAQIMAIAAAFSSVGVEAEAGGTAVQKALGAMNTAVLTGKDLDAFGSVSGMSGGKFSEMFRQNPAEAFARFVEGVGGAGKSGELLLNRAGINDQRQIMAFGNLASAGNMLRESLGLANQAWAENTALTKEAEQRYRTFASQVILLKNQIYDLSITFGQQLIESLMRLKPAIETVVGWVVKGVEWFSRLPEPVQTSAFAVAALAAAAGPLTFMFGTLMKAGAGVASVLKLGAGLFVPAAKGASFLALAMRGLAQATLAVGAAWAGWQIGKAIDQKTGASDWVGQAAAYVGESMLLLPKGSSDAYRSGAKAGIKAGGTPPSSSSAASEKMSEAQKLIQQSEQLERDLSGALKSPAFDINSGGAASQQEVNAALERRKDLTGEAVKAAALLMTADIQAVGIANVTADKREHVNQVLANGIALMGDTAPQAMREFASATMPRLEEIGDQVQNVASLTSTMTDELRELSGVNAPIPPVIAELPSAEENFANIASLTGTITDNLREMGDVNPPSEWAGFFSPQGLQQMADILYRLANDFGGTAGNVIGGIGGIVGSIGAYQQNGMPKGAMGKISALANMAGAIWGSTEAGGGKGMNALSGAMSGAAMGMAFGPVGAAWGATAGALVGWAKSMMVSKEEKSAREEALAFQNELIAKFAETATAAQLAEGQGERWRVVNIAVRDAYLAIGKSEAEAMADLEKFNNATRQSAEAVQAAAGVIAQAFEEQAADVARLDEAVKRYGFTFEELGSKLQNKNSLAAGKELIEDWRVLTQAGIGVETVNARMGESMATYLQTALSVGAEVPAAMKPILEMMAQQGVLMDAAGNGFSTLEGLSVNWSETLTQGFDRVIVKLDQLINSLIAAGTAISPLDGSVVAAAGGAGASATPAPLTGLGLYHGWQEYLKAQGKDGVFMMIEAQKHATAGDPIPAMAKGGIVRRPTFAMIGEAGPEAVVPLDGDQSGVGGFHLHGPITVVANNAEEFAASLIKVVRRNTGSARTSLRNLMPRPA
jgi:TP901 family phage tail tape measure protein